MLGIEQIIEAAAGEFLGDHVGGESGCRQASG
jgi:hypothetical protein